MTTDSWFTFFIGFLSQALFSARLLIQWIKSEKAGSSLTPSIFWQLSILASWLLFIYGILRDDFAIVLGQCISYFIYIRNLKLQNKWQELPQVSRHIALLTPIIAFILLAKNNKELYAHLFQNTEIPLTLLLWGVIGQLIFTFRFIYQWVYSEQKKRSCLPLGFWIISLAGSSMILSYAVFRHDPVLFIGQGFGFVVYARNILLIRKQACQQNV